MIRWARLSYRSAADSQTFEPMMEQARRNTGRAPTQALTDAGYCSQANLAAAATITEQTGTEFLIAPGRRGHDEVVPPPPRGRIPKDFTLKQRMARKLRTLHRHLRVAGQGTLRPVTGDPGASTAGVPPLP
jgi:hypothetical protein